MISQERVQAAIDRVRPYLNSDGGDIELVEVLENRAKVKLVGNCVGCPSAHLTLYLGIENAIREDIPEFEELVIV